MRRLFPRFGGFPVLRERHVRERRPISFGCNMPSMALHLIREPSVAIGPTRGPAPAASRGSARPAERNDSSRSDK
jgi:hypothetical protein